jgi:hypothetical protein
MLASKVRDFVPFSAEFRSKRDPTCQFGVAERNRRSKGVGRSESAPKKSVRGTFRGETAGPGRSGSPSSRGSRSVGAPALDRWRLMRSPTAFPVIPPTWDRLATRPVQVSRARHGRPPLGQTPWQGSTGKSALHAIGVAIQLHTLMYSRESLLADPSSLPIIPRRCEALTRFTFAGRRGYD